MMLKRGVEEEFEWRSGRGSGDLSNAVNAIVLDNSSCVRRLHTSLISGNKVSSPCVTCDISVAFFCESMFFFPNPHKCVCVLSLFPFCLTKVDSSL